MALAGGGFRFLCVMLSGHRYHFMSHCFPDSGYLNHVITL